MKSRLTLAELETYHTAVHYLIVHAVGLILVGLLGLRRPCRLLGLAGSTMLAGTVLFSGFLLGWVATGQRAFVCPVPARGVALIVAWLLVAAGAWGVARP